MSIATLPIGDIQATEATQQRAALHEPTVADYAEAMLAGAVFPPVVVFHDGAAYWLADGFHRVAAARHAGLSELQADIKQGTRRDTMLYAVGANATHGLRRTNADKRRAVETLLNDPEWALWSDNEIARRCGVSQPFVSELRQSLSYNGYKIDSPRLVERNGTTYEMNTTQIGTPAAPVAVPVVAVPANHQLINSSASNEWYTPQQYIDAVYAVMGAIDLDPASSELANQTIKAARFFSAEQDGLKHWWAGRVFCNPPYGITNGESNQELWSRKLIAEYQAGRVLEAVMLVNAASGSNWFAPLWDYPICFVSKRIRFYNTGSDADAPTHSNVFVYFGPHVDRFISVFTQFGPVAGRLVVEGTRIKVDLQDAA